MRTESSGEVDRGERSVAVGTGVIAELPFFVTCPCVMSPGCSLVPLECAGARQ